MAAEAEFSQYVKEARPELRRRAFLLCGDWHRADDLVQDTLIRVFHHWNALERRDSLTGYTRTVMVRLFISSRRAMGQSRELLTDQPPDQDAEPSRHDSLDDRLLLVEALRRLGARQRATIVLRYWEHLTVEEAAEALSCTAATIRSQTTRALANLRSHLQMTG